MTKAPIRKSSADKRPHLFLNRILYIFYRNIPNYLNINLVFWTKTLRIKTLCIFRAEIIVLALHCQNVCSVHPLILVVSNKGVIAIMFLTGAMFKVNMIITVSVTVCSPQSNLIFIPFKTDFMKVFENCALFIEEI